MRSAVVAVIFGIVLLAAGAVDLAALYHRADRIEAADTAVDARVVEIPKTIPRRTFQVVRLDYTYGGRTYRSDLLDIGLKTLPSAGDQVTLAIDPAHPGDATFPGFVSGSRWRYWYLPAWIIGVNALIIGGSLWRDLRGSVPAPIIPETLRHPRPAWGDRADDKVLTLVLPSRPGDVPREEELPVRRVDNDTYEICCVPFLQLRLALGDIVRLTPGGHVGAVVRPSERVGVAVRCTSRAAETEVRGLTDEFPGTVLEEVNEDGAFALAAGSSEGARGILGRLREWGVDGRLEYRSVLRSDGVDSALL